MTSRYGRNSRLDHQHVGALERRRAGLDERLAAVRRVLLVGLLVAEAGVRVEGVAEGAVVRRRVLRRVREDRHVGEALGVEGVADRRRRGRPSCPTARRRRSPRAPGTRRREGGRTSIVSSLRIRPSSTMPAVAGSRGGSSATSVHTIESGSASVEHRHRPRARSRSPYASSPRFDLRLSSTFGNSTNCCTPYCHVLRLGEHALEAVGALPTFVAPPLGASSPRRG